MKALLQDGRQAHMPTPPEKRLLINRRKNGTLSKGPTSEAGKAVSRMNALKAGLFAKVIPYRECPLVADKTEFEALVDELRSDFAPATCLGGILVESLAFDLLRLRFLVSLQSEIMEGRFTHEDRELRRLRRSASDQLHGESIEQVEMAVRALETAARCLEQGHAVELDRCDAEVAADRLWRRMTGRDRMIEMMERDIKALEQFQAREVEPDKRERYDRQIEERQAKAEDLTRATVEARRQALHMIPVFRKYLPRLQDCYLISTGSTIGLRESRRILGEHVLTETEIKNACRISR